ncbi:JAB domain-containing protein [candidate division KSB1 bacterium]|nr:JAB domain-containing protein [candidate division KSB1 bacterium]NIT74172.1 JAB domain-containing protein [candidate division KSB1 bacterium]NIX73852.1 DNA repair protein RadC [candidate division KSB1 bacterium]
MARYTPKIPEWPEDDRPRERLIKFGADKLSDAEILAILLRVGNQETTAIDLARHLIKEFGGFRGMDGKSVSELCEVNGIGMAKAAQIKAAMELGKRLFLEEAGSKVRVECSEDVYRIVNPYLRDLSREVFKIILLTSRNRLIHEKTIFEGSLTESIVSPREIVKEAINHSAASVVFVHNHPSGNPEPSEEDKRVTRQLKSACQVVGVSVLDHVIIGDDGFFSFADAGLL